MAPTQGSLIKAQMQPQVYVIDANGRKDWIPDPATLLSRWKWSDVHTLPDVVVNAIPLGPPIPSVLATHQWPDGALLQSAGDPHIYVVQGGQRHWIPDPQTFTANGYDWSRVDVLPPDVVNAVPLGAPIPPTDRLILETGDVSISAPLGGHSHFMNTRAGLTRATGDFTAETRTWVTTWLGGFHGGVSIVLHDADDLPVANGVIPVQRFGVDGRMLGNSDRTDAWPVPPLKLDPAIAQRVANMVCFETWSSDTFQQILDNWVQAGQKVAELIKSASQIATVFHGSGAPAGTPATAGSRP